jgi:hypothetical protein
MLFSRDRVILVNACLSNIYLYMLYFIEAPKGVIKKIDTQIKNGVA